MSADRPAITVLLATRDRPALLADALASVRAQRLRPLEVRIGDAGEAPIGRVLEAFADLGPVRIPSGGSGPAATRNLAARGARGDVLALLDDDDRWRPGHLEGLAGAFADPAAGFAHRDCEVIRERVRPDGTREALGRRAIARAWDAEVMRRDDYLPPSGWAVRRALFERLGGFDESFAFSEDWDFLLRLARETAPRRVPGVTVEVRLRESGNASAEAGPERLACLERLAARHGLSPIPPRTFWEVAALVGAEAPA